MSKKSNIEYAVDDTKTYEILDYTPEECDVLLEEEIKKIKQGKAEE